MQTLRYEEGSFEFVFPTVVGPRYMPGAPSGQQGGGVAADTPQVPDASRISPPLAAAGSRGGHDIGLRVEIDAGAEIAEIDSPTHRVTVERPGDAGERRRQRATVTLANDRVIPNRDFVLRYRTATDEISDSFFVHRDERGQFFTLVLQPPRRVERKQAVGRELVFVLDTSGSMRGFPIAKAKGVVARAVDGMGERDTFNLVTFSGDTRILWDAPRPATAANRAEAQDFLSLQQGRGGTEMMKAIEAALVQTARPADEERQGPEPIRVVGFMTDGFVGNDMAIIDAVKRNAAATRVFSFGVGNSVNTFLLDGMAHAGRGAVEYVMLESRGDEAARRLYRRIDAPVLTDVTVDWGDLPADEVYPAAGAVPDLFDAQPVVLHGRLKGDVKPGTAITLRGNTAAGPFDRRIEIKPAAAAADAAPHAALASLWARAKVTDLMMRDMAALQRGDLPPELKDPITALGLEFRLMTPFTSFVAVEERIVTSGGEGKTVNVPVEVPDGVSREGITGEKDGAGEMLVASGGHLPGGGDDLSAIGLSAAGGWSGTGTGTGEGRGSGAGRGGPLAPFGTPGGGGLGPKSRFMGVGGNARTVAFVCGVSAEHAGAVKAELGKAVTGLKPIQGFNLFVLGEDGRSLALDDKSLTLAKPETKQAATALIGRHAPKRRPDAAEVIACLESAFRQKPNTLYLLLDAGLPADQAELVQKRVRALNPDKKIKVNVLVFSPGSTADGPGVDAARRIAAENGGVYKFVGGDDAKQ